MKDNNVILEVKDLHKSFGEQEVLKGISTEVNRGDVIAIIGPSGCGKSTFLRSLNLLEIPTSGQILFEGTDLTDKSTDINVTRQKIGMVFQQFNLFANMTIKANIMLAPVKLGVMTKDEASKKADELLTRIGLLNKADAYPAQLSGGQKQRVAIIRSLAMNPDVILFDEPTSALDPEMVAEVTAEARELLKKVGLENKEDSYPGQLSGGQQQRVAIARALAMNPKMLFFDEPTSALDPEITAGILKLLRELANEKMTMVIVTHEIDFARNVADRVIFMDGGVIVEEGKPQDVIDNPKSERTKAFLQKMA